jgi:hypothetical protein
MPRPGLTVDHYAILRMPGQAWAFRVSEVRSYQPTQSFSTSSGTHVATFPLGPVEITVTGYDPVAVDLAEVDAFAQAAHIRQGGRPTPKPAPPPPPAQAPDPPPDPDPVPSRPVRIPRDMPVSYALLADLAEDDRLALNLLWLSWPLVRPYWPADRAGFGRRRYGLAHLRAPMATPADFARDAAAIEATKIQDPEQRRAAFAAIGVAESDAPF